MKERGDDKGVGAKVHETTTGEEGTLTKYTEKQDAVREGRKSQHGERRANRVEKAEEEEQETGRKARR